METVDVQYAKTHLSALLNAVEHGEEITISRGDRPVARLAPMKETEERELGFVAYQVPDSFFDPLPEKEFAAWTAAAHQGEDLPYRGIPGRATT